jgi:hypothetical protein
VALSFDIFCSLSAENQHLDEAASARCGFALYRLHHVIRAASVTTISQDVFAQQEGPSQGTETRTPAPLGGNAMLKLLASIGHHPWR